MLPDDVLLAIFDFCAYKRGWKEDVEAWQKLVHVCRRWRTVVFESPCRLDLRLVCATETPARDTLDVWPALPLAIQYAGDPRIGNVDNIVAVLERSNRVFQIDLPEVLGSDLENISAAMQVPFPELTHLQFASVSRLMEKTMPVLPDSFLGGSAPRLQKLLFHRIPFPGLPKLLLSATHLTDLSLFNIPHSGYFSPEAMITALSTLTSLQILRLMFESPRSCPDRETRRPPLQTNIVLPDLTCFWFKGVTEYLEDLVASVDAPRLYTFDITFFNDIVFDTPQLIQFIGRAPTLTPLEEASVSLAYGTASVGLTSRTSRHVPRLHVKILCRDSDWQISSVEQICTSCLPFLFILKDLYIFEGQLRQWKGNIENTQWLELLRPFTAVKNLYLSQEVARLIMPALQELDGGRTTEVLPALENTFLEGLEPSGPIQEGIGKFVATRQVIGHPISVSRWDRPWGKR